MSLSSRALQRKREKKKKKRQIKLVSQGMPIVTGINWPIYECWVTEKTCFLEQGIGHVVVSRKNVHSDNIVVGVYLVDIFCLGVKNCFYHITSIYNYKEILEGIKESDGGIELVEPTYANTLIYKAIDYAQQFGFRPHEDFDKAQKLLRNIPLSKEQEFTFGKNGMPLYIRGPNETLSDAKRILQMLELKVGRGNYHYIIGTENFPR